MKKYYTEPEVIVTVYENTTSVLVVSGVGEGLVDGGNEDDWQ